MTTISQIGRETVGIPVRGVELIGDLMVPERPRGLVVFAHGSGSGRASSRNQFVASALNDRRFATLLFDLLTPDEIAIDEVTRHLRFDIGFLAARLAGAIDWTANHRSIASLPLGLFGASTGAAAALVAAAARPESVSAVVSRGGRPDLVLRVLHHVHAPTLLVVGGEDHEVIAVNELAFKRLRSPKELVLVNRATHLFEETGTLEEVARLAGAWFERHLDAAQSSPSRPLPDPVDEIC